MDMISTMSYISVDVAHSSFSPKRIQNNDDGKK
jgi:hypothetical protein